MSQTHRFEKMFPKAFREEFERAPVIYCPFGLVEYHGTHMDMAADLRKGYEICLKAADISGGIVHPVVPLAPAGKYPSYTYEQLKTAIDYQAYPGVFVDRNVCKAAYEQLLYSFAECLKFKVCVPFGDHGPAADLLAEIARENNGRIGGMKLVLQELPILDLLLEKKKQHNFTSSSNHAGMWETSMNASINPDSVDLSELDKPLDGFHDFGNHIKEENRHVDASFGEKLISVYAAALAERVKKELK